MSGELRKERISTALTSGLKPLEIQVIDESHHHVGHAGAQPEGETHYRVVMQAECFSGKTKLQRHRLVNALLVDEFNAGLHALTLQLSAPDEAAA